MERRSTRVQRVGRELFELLNNYLLKRLHEPLPCYVSITAVETSPDLRYARVFFRLVGQESVTRRGEEILAGLRPQFQKHVADHLDMKFCPVLKFEFGKVQELDEIDKMLSKLRNPSGFGE